MKKQPEITEATRDAFVEAYCKIAYYKDDRKITIKEITDLSGYNRTTFYRYFSDIIAVRENLEDRIIIQIIANLKDKLLNETFDTSFYEVFLIVCNEYRRELMILIRKSNREHFIEKIKNYIKPIFQTIYNIDQVSRRTDLIMTIYFSGVFAVLAEWLKEPDQITEDELLEIIGSLFNDWFIKEIRH